MRTLLAVCLVLLLPLFAPAKTILVPQDKATIQAAIDFAIHGDTILVAPGTYVETIDFSRKNITVRSDGDGNPATVDLAPED